MSNAHPKSSLLVIFAPLLSLVVYAIGHGLLGTLLTVRMSAEEVSPQWIGFISSAYFAGLIAGTFVNTRIILRVGHIRAYAVYASILASVALVFGLVVRPEIWLVLRLVGGFATGGLFVVIESWLMVSTTTNQRGRVMGLYMVLFYASMATGQLLLKSVDIMLLVPFTLAALASSLSIIPLALTKTKSPQFEDHGRLSLRKLVSITPAGVASSFSAGLLLGVIYGLLPLFFFRVGLEVGATANMMAVVIIGGMCLQYPLGRISDRFDRRLVLALLFSLILILSCLCIWMNVTENQLLTAAFMFLFGGAMFSIYPISLSHACDELPSGQTINGNQGMLRSYSIGAMTGPIVAPQFISMAGPPGLFAYFIAVTSLVLAFLFWRRFVRKPVPLRDHSQFATAVPNTSLMSEYDPRSEHADTLDKMGSKQDGEPSNQDIADADSKSMNQ